jgi:endonuclease/exonuclease/phosphatase (EEP) superfamily protein YafD
VRALLTLLSFVYLLALGWHLGQIALGVEPVGWLGLVRELTLYLFLPAPVFLFFALLVQARAAFVFSLLPIVVLIAIYEPRFVPRAQPPPAGPTFRLMTFNAGAGAGGGDPQPVLAAIQSVQADVVALQEVPAQTRQIVGTAIEAQYPYHVSTPDVVTFSVFPLSNAQEVHLPDAAYTSQAVDILVNDRLVHLTNVHLLRTGPQISGRRSVAAFVRNYQPGLTESQVSALVERYIRPVSGSQLLTGDFNQTDWSRSYDRLANVLNDSFREAGRGFGHTYPSDLGLGRTLISLPLVRIDYIFHSADMRAVSARVGPDGGSDHLPVIADLAFE